MVMIKMMKMMRTRTMRMKMMKVIMLMIVGYLVHFSSLQKALLRSLFLHP